MPTTTPPFSHLLVPYDGSDPARAALKLAVALAAGGAKLTVATVVNEMAVIAQSATTMMVYDPTPLMDALDSQGKALLDDAVAFCGAAKVTVAVQLVHDTPVSGIANLVDERGCDLVVMGTHARTGMARTFLGSTTEGLLRLSRVPVLTVRSADRVADAPFAIALVALDDSEPADAAAAVAARLARTAAAKVVACHAVDTTQLYENAVAYGFDPEQLGDEMRQEAAGIVKNALARASLAPDTAIAIVDGDPVGAVIAAAEQQHATVIVVGTHGRRGLRRFVLGSVAESILRASDIPVLVVPATKAG
jgi:nucleotide-binding universal stress UspA family protein